MHYFKKEYMHQYFGHLIVHIHKEIGNMREVYPTPLLVSANVCIIAFLLSIGLYLLAKYGHCNWKNFVQYQHKSWTFGRKHPVGVRNLQPYNLKKNMYITLFIYVPIVRDVLNKNRDLQKIIYFTWKRRWNEVLHEIF